jgi:tRNA dimethylallyltransferase
LREERGNDYLYHRLLEADPLAAETMRPTNWKRVLRALEIKLSTGESILDFHRAHQRNCDIQFQQFGIAPDRKTLYARIDQRVDQMMLQGLIEETKKISAMGFSASDNALNTVGYKEALSYLQNEIPLDEAVRLIKRNTRHYAKRQMTWFNKDRRIHWIRFQI